MPKKKNMVNVHFILDKSGSMTSVKNATISAFNEYVETLKNDKKSEYRMTLTLFDTEVVERFSNTKLLSVEKLNAENYNPDGFTALYDAVCRTVKGVKGDSAKSDKNLVVIMTDGQENSSKEYNLEAFKAMVDEVAKDKNWTFVYLGANQDSWANAQKFGFDKGNVTNFNQSDLGIKNAMRGTAQATMCYAAQSELSTQSFYSEKQKKDILKDS